MTQTFSLVFFTNTDDKIIALDMKGVKIFIEDNLLAITPHGIAGYKKGGEVYNYLNSHFGEEKRGVFEIPLKDIQNVATNKTHMGINVIACIDFGGHGIIIFNRNSKTLEFTRNLIKQMEKKGLKVGSDKQNMPELEITDGVLSVKSGSWRKYLYMGIGIVAILFFIGFLERTFKSTNESTSSISKNQKGVPDSLKFMIVGDGNFEDYKMSDVTFSNCRLSYIFDFMGKYKIEVNFNKVNFKSLDYTYPKGIQNFSFSCQGNCTEISAPDGDEASVAMLKLMKTSLPQNKFQSPIYSSMLRFEKALSDFTAICPGVSSKY